MSILVIAEHDNNELKGSTLNTVTAASKIGGNVSVLVVGSDSLSAAEQAKSRHCKSASGKRETLLHAESWAAVSGFTQRPVNGWPYPEKSHI